MNKEKFAEMLNGRNYRNECSIEENELAKNNDLLVVFGASDDLMEFRGVIYDELGAWDGVVAYITANKQNKLDILQVDDDNDIDEYRPFTKIEAEWCPKGELGEIVSSWIIKTDIPHATFDIMEDGDLYCRGIVLDESDVLKSMRTK